MLAPVDSADSSAHSRRVPATTMTCASDDATPCSLPRGGARAPRAVTWFRCVTPDPHLRLHVACIMDGNGRWAGRRGPAPHRGPHRGRGEPRPPRAHRRDPRHRLAHGVRVLHGELDPPPRRGPPHPRPARQAVRSGAGAERAQRADPVDRPPVRHTRRPHAEVRPAGDPQGDQRHVRQHRDAAHRGLRLRRPPGADRRRPADDGRGSRGDDRGDRRAPLPARAAAGRRARAHVRRAAGLQLPALAERRSARSTSRTRPGPTSTPPSSTPRWPSSRVPRPRRPLLAAPRGARSLARELARSAERRRARRRGLRRAWPSSSPRRSTRGRHLVVQAGTGTGKTLAYLVPADRPRAPASSWPRRPRRCRTSSPARTCRSCSRRCRCRSTGRCSRAAATTCACNGCARCTADRTRSSSSRA